MLIAAVVLLLLTVLFLLTVIIKQSTIIAVQKEIINPENEMFRLDPMEVYAAIEKRLNIPPLDPNNEK